MKHTIFRLCGFMQAIIGNYAVPILERKTVWDTNGRTLTIAGPKAWTTTDIIKLCEDLSGGSKAKVVKVPVWILKVTRGLLSCFQPARDAADRLAFTDLSLGDLKPDYAME